MRQVTDFFVFHFEQMRFGAFDRSGCQDIGKVGIQPGQQFITDGLAKSQNQQIANVGRMLS